MKYLFAAVLLCSGLETACLTNRPSQLEQKENLWIRWQTLDPVVEIAQNYVSEKTRGSLRRVGRMLAQDRAKQAYLELENKSSRLDRHWVNVVQANVSALYFVVCIRGEAWRLAEGSKQPRTRTIDFSLQTEIEDHDVSVEDLLTGLDKAIDSRQAPLVDQARIARSRVASIAIRCPATEQVARRAQDILRNDLAILATEAKLTPDLAYLWGAMQLSERSAAAAEPFLQQASSQGYDDPSFDYVSALVALELGHLDKAFRLAQKADRQFQQFGDSEQKAEVLYTLGKIELRRGNQKSADRYWRRVLEEFPGHPGAMVGRIQLIQDGQGVSAAVNFVQRSLVELMKKGGNVTDGYRQMVENLELIIFYDGEDQESLLTEILREGLLFDVDAEPDPVRRGLRYFFAATLEVRLGEIELARGHASIAETEISEGELEQSPVKVRAFLDRLTAAMP